jgi:hypothetical protein
MTTNRGDGVRKKRKLKDVRERNGVSREENTPGDRVFGTGKRSAKHARVENFVFRRSPLQRPIPIVAGRVVKESIGGGGLEDRAERISLALRRWGCFS